MVPPSFFPGMERWMYKNRQQSRAKREDKRGEAMRKKGVRRQIEELAQSRVNDAGRLAFLKEEELEELKELDLSALTEFRRSGTGTVEMKFVDRLSALRWLAENERDPRAKRLYEALERGAQRLEGES